MGTKVRKKVPKEGKPKAKPKKKEANQYSAPARYKQIKSIKKRRRDIMKDLDNS